MAQSYEFKVVGIGSEGEWAEVRLSGKFHSTYSSPIFLKLPAGELSKFSIGQSYSLVAQSMGELIETVPLDDARSRFDDGSPVPEDDAAAIERRGGYRL